MLAILWVVSKINNKSLELIDLEGLPQTGLISF